MAEQTKTLWARMCEWRLMCSNLQINDRCNIKEVILLQRAISVEFKISKAYRRDHQAHDYHQLQVFGSVDAEGGRAIAYRSCDERNEGNNERKRRERQSTRSKAREKSANRGDN